MTNDPDHEPHHAISPTGHILEELALYGHRPFDDEPDPRPLPEAASRAASESLSPTPASEASGSAPAPSGGSSGAPAWAKWLRRRQTMAQGAMLTAHTLRSADHGGGAAHISLEDRSSTRSAVLRRVSAASRNPRRPISVPPRRGTTASARRANRRIAGG